MTGQVQAAVLSKREAADLCGISTATLDRLRVKGDFVKPIQLGKQAIRFRRSELETWLATRPTLLHLVNSVEL
jgi:predicted DNA-binding transcriptional regulator AlpA